MNQSKSGSYYDSTRNARPYTNSYGGSSQHLHQYDNYDNSYGDDDYNQREEDDYEDEDYEDEDEDEDEYAVYANDEYDDENLNEEDDYYGRNTIGRETGSYNNYENSNAQRNNFGYGNYSGRGDYGYRDQHTLPRYNNGASNFNSRRDQSTERERSRGRQREFY